MQLRVAAVRNRDKFYILREIEAKFPWRQGSNAIHLFIAVRKYVRPAAAAAATVGMGGKEGRSVASHRARPIPSGPMPAFDWTTQAVSEMVSDFHGWAELVAHLEGWWPSAVREAENK